MKAFSLILLLLALVQYSTEYVISSTGPSGGYSSSYTSSSSSSSGYGGPNAYSNCCQLNPWASAHMDEIRQFANRLSLEYNRMSHGGSAYSNNFGTPWRTNIIQLAGKTQSELDAITRRLSEQLVSDMRNGVITHQTVFQPSFFDWKAAEALKTFDNNWGQLQQQQVQDSFDLSNGFTSNSFINAGASTYPPSAITVSRPTYISPGSTVTIKSTNRTIITNADGTNTVSGSEINKKWIDGKLVIDTERPFGEWSVPRDEQWKRDEREQFFWFLSQGATTTQNLEYWQRQQEERLQALAQHYHISTNVICDWHKKELNRYLELLRQYQTTSNDLTGWQRLERGRLDWLIHQNSVSREELQRWQLENQSRLAQLARQYQISLEELKGWQIGELNRLYIYFNNQNNSMLQRPNSDSLYRSEEERLNELIRQHNMSISQFQESIKSDQQKLIELSKTYKGSVEDMDAWLKAQLTKLRGDITNQQHEMIRITEWQRSERERLENIVRQHHGSVGDIEEQMQRDRSYIQALALKYKVSIEDLEQWQRTELTRLQNQGRTELELEIKGWQRQERERLVNIIKKSDLTIEEFQQMIIDDRVRLEELARTYKIQVSEVEEWIRNEIKSFQSQGLLKEVEKELAQWQQLERNRLLSIVRQHELTVEELQQKIRNDQTYLNMLANTYHVQMEEIQEWLKKELLRMQSEGLIKVEDLKEWQKNERDEILKIVQHNKLTVEEFEKKLLSDRQRLQILSNTYNVQISEIETWIKKEGERLQSLGLLKMQEQLNNWQKIERERLLLLIKQNNLSVEELELRIKNDQAHIYTLARQNQVRVEEIEEWIKKEIQKLQMEGVLEMQKLKDWQTEWRQNLINLVKERDFTVEEFHKWLLEDRARLQALATQHKVEIEEIEQWIRNEEQHFISIGLLKPNEKLTNWQQIERNYLERITQERYQSTEQLELRLRQDREMIEKLAKDYSIQVEEIERWMRKELARLRDEGQLQIENLTAWQIAERERLEQLIKQQKQYTVEEFEALLRQDREHMQKMAFQYHTSVEEIEKWVQSEVNRLRQQGKLDIENLTVWQKTEQKRILNLLQQQSSITLEEFERKVENDRSFLLQLAHQHRVSIVEIEAYIKKVIEDLRNKGKFEIENLQMWQKIERNYIKDLIAQYKNSLSTKEYEQKLLNDRVHLQQLADQYRINQNQIEQWMIEELRRLRQGSEINMQQLSAWQQAEVQRIKDLIRQNSQLTYLEYEVQLMEERARLQELAKQHSMSVEQIENWLRQQLVNLKTTGDVQVENLTIWQEAEQKHLIEMLLQQQHQISFEEFELQLKRDRARLQQLAQQYSVTVEQIERYMRDELQRLQNSGLLQVEQLTTWQRLERENLINWLKKHNNAVTSEQFNEFLTRDRARLQQIAQDYHVTVEDVKSWVRQESARLRFLGVVSSESVINVDTSSTSNDIWKDHTRNQLIAVSHVKPFMTWQDFDRYVAEKRTNNEKLANQYNISVEEIELWLRQNAENFRLIQGNVSVEDWQINEQRHILDLINERLLKQQQWSIEELERKLKNDQNYLQQLALRYHLAIDEIETWYKQELQRLLNQRKIISEHLIDWQRQEKERIYWIVNRQPKMSVTSLTEQLLRDRNTINRLANQYHVTIQELDNWIRNEVKRLVDLGLVTHSLITKNDWQQKENERLRTIAAEISITSEELLEFIEHDNIFNTQLMKLYACALKELAPTQRIIIDSMQKEGLLDNTKLLRLEKWQKNEREQLYTFLSVPNFDLKEHQRTDIRFIQDTADMYGINVETLKNWQLEEYERLQKLAAHYQMTLSQLKDFRKNELLYIDYVMHKKLSNEAERIQWAQTESKRMGEFRKKTGYNDAKLLEWRRRLYLLCQGLVPLDFGNGGYEIGHGSTNTTASTQVNISEDRGDQPQKVYNENASGGEPGLEQKDALYPLPSAEMRVPPVTQKPWQTSHPSYLPPSRSYGGRSSEKRDVPMPNDDYNNERKQQQQQEEQIEDFGQQQQDDGQQQVQDDKTWNGGHTSGSYTNRYGNNQQQQQQEDFGQQQQLELGDYNQQDFGQQQVQVEDLSGTFQNTANQNGANQKQVATAGSQNQQQLEVKTEAEPTGFFSKIKKNIFG